jgi:hypothetical protein
LLSRPSHSFGLRLVSEDCRPSPSTFGANVYAFMSFVLNQGRQAWLHCWQDATLVKYL